VDLPVVWNSRLVSTAGQVLDDGSHNDTKLLPNQCVNACCVNVYVGRVLRMRLGSCRWLDVAVRDGSGLGIALSAHTSSWGKLQALFYRVGEHCAVEFDYPCIRMHGFIHPPALAPTCFPTCRRKIPCRLELSTKILTTMGRLRNTLAHEMCHVAAWLLEEDYDAPHGPAFWKWAQVGV
jgi:hypothetical protein